MAIRAIDPTTDPELHELVEEHIGNRDIDWDDDSAETDDNPSVLTHLIAAMLDDMMENTMQAARTAIYFLAQADWDLSEAMWAYYTSVAQAQGETEEVYAPFV